MSGQRGLVRLVAVGFFSLAVAACGGDDDDTSDDGGDTADDGDGGDGGDGDGGDGDGGQTLDQLTDDEAADICETTGEIVSIEALLDFSCYYAGLIQLQKNPEFDCEGFAQQCIDTTEPPDIEVTTCWIDPGLFVLPECASEITVDDVVDCLNGTAEQIADILDGISCDTDFEDVVSIEELATLELPAACLAIQEACAGLLD